MHLQMYISMLEEDHNPEGTPNYSIRPQFQPTPCHNHLCRPTRLAHNRTHPRPRKPHDGQGIVAFSFG